MRRSGFESSYYGAPAAGGYGGYPSQAAAAGYNYNSAGGYGGYPPQAAAAAGFPPVAYPPPSGYTTTLLGGATGHVMPPPPHGHGHAHGGYVAHGGNYGGHGYGYGNGKFNHGKFGNHGGFKTWK
uniref:Uncharacterized protein n=1 Tax=Kalanchoe fedtschenkoi TaxID=63787 RepID=A0A7N0VGX3_KALFE